MLNRILPVLFTSLFIGAAFSSKSAITIAAGDTVYVDTNAVGLNNGTSWTDAYTNLQLALTAEPVNKIFLVAKGIYYPGLAGNAAATFALKDGQQLLGGFPTGGADFTLRNPKLDTTILSGDLNRNGTVDDGTDARVIISLSGLSTVVVDGFTISGAINNGGNGGGILINNSFAIITNNIIENNQADFGAGMYNNNLSVTAPNISKNLIRQNTTLNNGKGGGLYVSGEVIVRNNVITANSSFFGGGVFVTETSLDASFINNTIVDNISPTPPSNPLADTCPSFSSILFQNLGGRMLLHNNIVWSSPITETTDGQIKQGTIYTDPTSSTILYNIVPNSSLNAVNGNKVTDPILNTDLSLTKCSPAVDQGLTNLLYQGGYNDSADYLGNKRLLDGNFDGSTILDIGAMESQLLCEPCTTSAGNDTSICGLQFTMRAKKPGFERSGKWIQLSGPGTTSFNFDTLETALINVSQQGTYSYRWTLTGTDCNISDDVVIAFYAQPTADAGRDTSICGKLVTNKAVTSFGTGTWSSIENGVSFVNNTEDTTLVSVTNYGIYHLIWTERNGGCPNSSDTMVFTAFQQNVANAGTDFNACQMDGDLRAIPNLGNGTWSQASGPGTATFSDAQSATSHVTVTSTGIYAFRWTEVNGACPSSSDMVSVNFKPQSIANGGPDIDTCGNIAYLDARPSSGTGIWSLVSGNGTVAFNQASYAKTKVTFSEVGQYVLRWSETNSPCPATTDDIVVNLAPASVVSLETITDKYCGTNDEILVGVRINGTPPFTFIMEAQHMRDTITTTNDYYIFSDNSEFKEQSQLDFRIVSFVDGRDCGALFNSNLVQVPRVGELLAPIGNGFTTGNTLLCTSNSTTMNLNYSNADDLTFTITDVAKGSTFIVAYRGGIVSFPANNLKYGNNLFRIVSVTKTVGGCPMILNGTTEINLVYKPVKYTTSVQNLTCFGSNDGSIILNIDNLSDITGIELNNQLNQELLNTRSIFNLTPGTYTIRVINDVGCSVTQNIVISQPSKINYNYIIVNPTCYGYTNGNVEIQATGGTGALAIRFNNTFTENAPFKFVNLGQGVYPVKIIDKNTGCVIFADSVRIVQPDSLIVNSLSVDANCDGTAFGNITLNTSGGTTPYSANISMGTYQLNLTGYTGTQYISQLQPGTYNIRVSDGRGCTRIFKDTIKQGVELVFKAEKIKDFDCESKGIIKITEPSTEPGITYSIDGVNFGSETEFDTLSPGTYTVTALAPNGCINRKQLVIENKNLPLQVTAVVIKHPGCYNSQDGVVHVKITGGSGSYSIIVDGSVMGSDTLIDSLAPGVHNFAVLDLKCEVLVSASATLFNPSDYDATVSFSKNPTCWNNHDGVLRIKSNSPNQGITQFSIDSGKTYQYGDIFANLYGGIYYIRTRDSKGCVSKLLTHDLPSPDTLKVSANFVNDFISRTADITASAMGGTPPYLYSIDGHTFASNNIFIDVPFDYVTISVSDSLGCVQSIILTLGDVSINDLTINNSLVLYPNPTTGKVSLSGIDVNRITSIHVFSILGEKLMETKPTSDKTIDLTSLNSGYYFILIGTKDASTIHRIEILK